MIIATCLGVPIGILIRLYNFPGKRILIRLIYFDSLPPVVAGLWYFFYHAEDLGLWSQFHALP